MYTCVVYYSLDGNTKEAAQTVRQALDADLIEISPIKPMPAGRGLTMFLGGFQASFGLGGKLRPLEKDLSQYSRMILGTPVWAGKPAAPVQRYLKEFPAKEKIAGIFTCSGGGDNESCLLYLRKLGCRPQAVAALADRKSPKSRENPEKLQAFLKALKV